MDPDTVTDTGLVTVPVAVLRNVKLKVHSNSNTTVKKSETEIGLISVVRGSFEFTRTLP